jgi:hypothetical protein
MLEDERAIVKRYAERRKEAGEYGNFGLMVQI